MIAIDSQPENPIIDKEWRHPRRGVGALRENSVIFARRLEVRGSERSCQNEPVVVRPAGNTEVVDKVPIVITLYIVIKPLC